MDPDESFAILARVWRRVSMSFLRDLILPHFFVFGSPLRRLPNNSAIIRFLIGFALCGVVFLFASREEPSMIALDPLQMRSATTFALTLVSLLVAKLVVGSHWPSVGLRPVRAWNRREALYAIQVFPVAAVAFAYLFRAQLADMIEANGVTGFIFLNLTFGLTWGFYQEFVYRGLLQNALASSVGPIAGLLIANIAYTFGPLHFDLYDAADPQKMMLFAPIFGIGLIFGLIYQRSGNLWLPAILHGLWPLNMA